MISFKKMKTYLDSTPCGKKNAGEPEAKYYMSWFIWAEKKSKKFKQKKCNKCGLWHLWERKK